MIWLWLAFGVMLVSFGCWLCLFWFAADDEQPIRELDGINDWECYVDQTRAEWWADE